MLWWSTDTHLTLATGTAEREAALEMVADRPGRHRITLGANKAYDVADRLVPNLVIQRQPDKPAEQQIVVELLHHLLLRTHRVEGLQQQGAKQSLWAESTAGQIGRTASQIPAIEPPAPRPLSAG